MRFLLGFLTGVGAAWAALSIWQGRLPEDDEPGPAPYVDEIFEPFWEHKPDPFNYEKMRASHEHSGRPGYEDSIADGRPAGLRADDSVRLRQERRLNDVLNPRWCCGGQRP